MFDVEDVTAYSADFSCLELISPNRALMFYAVWSSPSLAN